MRLGVGLGVLGLGVVALGWWARAHYAPYMQDVVTAQSQVLAMASVHGVQASVAGRDITVTGTVDGPAEHQALFSAFDAVRGRRVVHDRTVVLPLVDPYTLSATALNGAVTASGHAPNEGVRNRLAAQAAGELTLAAGAPDATWPDAAGLGLAALAVFEEGQLQISGRSLAFSGVLATPQAEADIRAALAVLPADYTSSFDVTYLDDGTPPAWRLSHDAALGARLSGKLPMGVSGAQVAEALGVATLDDTSTVALMGDAGAVSPVLARLAPWMADIETLTIAEGPDGTEVEVGFGAGADLELLGAALGADLDGAARNLTLHLREVPATGADGDRRTHVASGRDEVLAGGFWLPAPGFAPDATTCAAQVDAVLGASRIGFVTGSSRLDARARGAVNALAGVLSPCLREAGLRAEIGGHTDATGSEDANLALSRERASAVRAALLARGVPEAGLAAEGYGASQPIADNATEEGRAANRRTAVRWIE